MIWRSYIAKCTLVIWQLCIAKSMLINWRSCIAKWRWQFGDIPLLSSNNRVSSFYWIRGSKHCFLTSSSYLNCYFLLLIFLRNRYLLVSLSLSRLHENSIFCPIFSFLCDSKLLCCTCAPISLAHITCFLKARCSQEPVIRISTGFVSPFYLLPKVSHANVHWANATHTFSSQKNPWTDTFSCDISLH